MPHTLPQLDTRRGGFPLSDNVLGSRCCTMVNDCEPSGKETTRCPNQGVRAMLFCGGGVMQASICMSRYEVWLFQGARIL